MIWYERVIIGGREADRKNEEARGGQSGQNHGLESIAAGARGESWQCRNDVCNAMDVCVSSRDGDEVGEARWPR